MSGRRSFRPLQGALLGLFAVGALLATLFASEPTEDRDGYYFWSSSAGDVIFRVLIRGRVVLEQQLGGKSPGPKLLKCSFSPTRRITLQLDPNGSPKSDCASWIQPLVR